ncbi:hypothetical protein [Micromonospora sp. NPDC005299]|uniref:hypothetical protein n=1 Tax=Micromonospora sp. NPDC005299 TaxID=3364231 RepID=UPI0036ACA8E3
MHGTRFARGQWQPQLPALAAEFPVAAVDLPGHGSRGRTLEPRPGRRRRGGGGPRP